MLLACSEFVTRCPRHSFCTIDGYNSPLPLISFPHFSLEANPMLPAGKSLRTLREKLGLTMRDVETSSARVADKYRNEEFSIPPSRLSDIETKGILPSIYRLYTLSVIYRRDVRELMSWYGVDLNNLAADLGLVAPPKSHVSDALAGLSSVQVPVRMDPGFDERRTSNLGRMVEQWGLVPIAYLAQFSNTDFTYGYVG